MIAVPQQTNLFYPSFIVSDEDVHALAVCNRELSDPDFYLLKDEILKTFGVFIGFDLQEWYDYHNPPWDWDMTPQEWFEYCQGWYGEMPIYATHRHIHRRYRLGACSFHVPTGAFHYYQEDYGVKKKSLDFDKILPLCIGLIEGRKSERSQYYHPRLVKESKTHLTRRFSFLLQEKRLRKSA